MKPVVLLVGRLQSVVEDIASQLEDLPIQWLAAHDRDEVARQLDVEPNIKCVVIGAGLEDNIRGDLVGVIAARRPDICIHLKDRSSGPAGMAQFVRRIVAIEVLNDTSN
jgi:hypothetical protein